MADKFNRSDKARDTDSERFSDSKIIEVHNELARDKEEPSQGFSTVPILLVFLFCALGFWGSVYFTRNAGATKFDGNTFVTAEVKEGPVDTGPKPVAQQIKDGEKLFNQNCAVCHQANGQGVSGAFPPLAGSPWVHGTPDRIIKIANFGIGGEIEVEGNKVNGAMPNIGQSLSDQKLADLVTYVRQAWGNKADPVDVDTVKAVRAATGQRGSWTPAEILAQHPLEK